MTGLNPECSAGDADLDLDSRFRWAIESLRALRAENPEFNSVFDIGAGNETLAQHVRDLGYTYQSFDVNPPSDSVKRWDIEKPFPDLGSADIVVMLEIVEHLNNPWLAMKNVAEVMNAGGYLLMSTPNPAWSGSRLAMVRRGVPAMFTESDLQLNHHVFTPLPHVIRRLLNDNGLEIVRFAQLGKPTSIFAKPFWGFKLPARVVFRLMKRSIEWMDTTALGALYGVLARKSAS